MNIVTGSPSSRRKGRFIHRPHNALYMGVKGYIFCFLMILPAIYGIVRYIYINSYSILLSFFTDVPFKSDFTLEHFHAFFTELFSFSSSMNIGLRNTFMYFGIGILKSFVCFIIAYFLYKKIPLFRVHRFLLFIPCIIPSVASVAIFKEIISKGGPIYTWLNTTFGVDYVQPWVASSNPRAALTSILLYMLLGSGIGNVYLIYIGNMKRIPDEMLESARLDGANSWREFWSFILPLTWGTFSTFLLISVAGIFTSSGPILYFFGDSETIFYLETQTLGYILFDKVRGDGVVAYYNSASAIGLVFTLFTIPIVILTRYISKKLNPEVTY